MDTITSMTTLNARSQPRALITKCTLVILKKFPGVMTRLAAFLLPMGVSLSMEVKPVIKIPTNSEIVIMVVTAFAKKNKN